MNILLGLTGGLVFLGAVIAQVVIRWKLRPPETDEAVYWEFEDQDHILNRYNLWLKRTLAIGALGILLQFLALVF